MSFEIENNLPIYLQLVEQLKMNIISGKLKGGERLPSVRDLALQNKVNPNTMQKALQEKYKHKWEPICPEIGQNKLLWMIGEVGEVIDIVKKNGGEKACNDPELRQAPRYVELP